MSGNLPSMLNIADNWAAAHMPTTHSYSGTLSAPAAQQAVAAGQHASYMWNLGQAAATNSSCAVSQYLRSGSAYLPPPTATPSITGSPLHSDVTTTSLTSLPGSSDHHQQQQHHVASAMHNYHDPTSTTPSLDNAVSSFLNTRDGRTSTASTNSWGPITPPAI